MTGIAPEPEFTGLNWLPITPLPEKVPPFKTGTKVAKAALSHKTLGELKLAFGKVFTTMVSLSVEVHPFTVIVYVTWKVPVPDTFGLNVPVKALVIPVPVHVPPGVAEVRFVELPPAQSIPGEVIVAFGFGFTVTTTVAEVSTQTPLLPTNWYAPAMEA